jgi:hypothetical protein
MTKEQTKEIIVTNPETFEKWFVSEQIKDTDIDKLGQAIEAMKPFVEEVKEQSITDKISFDEVDSKTKALKKIRLLIKNLLEPEWKGIFKKYKDKKAIMDGFCNPLAGVETKKKNEMIAYERKMEQIRKAAAEKAQREAEEKAREERERLEREAEEAAAAGNEEEFAEKAAQAEEISAQDYAPVQKPSYMPPKGTSIREKWVAEVTDIRALVKAVHEGKAPINCLIPNQVYLSQRARSDKGILKIPGVRVYDAGSVSMRTK